jgi:hypothetical protein
MELLLLKINEGRQPAALSKGEKLYDPQSSDQELIGY